MGTGWKIRNSSKERGYPCDKNPRSCALQEPAGYLFSPKHQSCNPAAHKERTKLPPYQGGRGVEFVWGPASLTPPPALPGVEHKHAGAEAAAQAADSNSAGFVGLSNSGKPALREKDFQSAPEHPCSFQALRPCDTGRSCHHHQLGTFPRGSGPVW